MKVESRKSLRVVVEAADAGERLDRILVARLPDYSRSRLQMLIQSGNVRVDGAAAKASLRPRAGAQLTIEVPAPEPSTLEPEEMDLPVLYEDAHLLVIDKPAGIAVHPGAGVRRGTVVHGLLHKVRDLAGIGGELRPGIVHRLDKDTSGCLVVAKTEAALRGLQAAFKARSVRKQYLALVHGKPPDQGAFDTAFGRHPVDRKRFSSKVNEGRRAVTRWKVLARAPGAALVSVELETGRTHQIRVHLSDAGWPLLGDKLYGGTRREAKLAAGEPVRKAAAVLGRQALHAALLEFSHPISGKIIRCKAPLPAEFAEALLALGMARPHLDVAAE